ncbi:hypothetical protein ALPO108162_16915 [Alicyclobacillus pomorum]
MQFANELTQQEAFWQEGLNKVEPTDTSCGLVMSIAKFDDRFRTGTA